MEQAQRLVNAVYAGAGGAVAVVQPAPPAPAPAAESVGTGGAGGAQVAPLAPTLAKGAGQALIWTRPVGGVFPASLPQIATCAAVQSPANGIKDLSDIPAEAWSRIEEPKDDYHFLCWMEAQSSRSYGKVLLSPS